MATWTPTQIQEVIKYSSEITDEAQAMRRLAILVSDRIAGVSNWTDNQKQEVVDKYNELKDDMQTAYQNLP